MVIVLSSLRAAMAKIDVTPPLHIPYLAYHPRQEFPKGTHDPLQARALVFEQDGVTSALLSVDSIGCSRKILGPGRDFTTELRQRVQQRTGIATDHLILATTHAHSTPETINFKPLREQPGAPEWMENLLDVLAECVLTAAERLRPARLKVGKGCCDAISWNRHAKDGTSRPIDPDVDVLLIEYEDAPPDTVLRFTCHPVIVQVQPLWSADFPGVACGVVERATGGNCLYLQGAAGDINPICDTASFDEVMRIGRCLGAEAWKVVEELRTPDRFVSPHRSPVIEGTMRIASSLISAPSCDLPDLAEWEKEEAEALRLLEVAASSEERDKASLRYRIAFNIADRIRMGGEPFEAEVQVLRIGEFALVAIPGELFVEFGFEIRDASSSRHTWVAAYCNDYLGYLSKPWAWEEKSYPAQVGPWSLVSQEGAQMIVNEAVRLLKEIAW